MRSARWTWPVVTLVVATGLFLFLFRDGWELADQKSSVLGMAFGGAGLLLALSQWWRGRSTPPALDLAEAVRAQWRQEERVRGVHDPYPLPVRWTNAPPELTDHWPTIHRDPDRDEPIDLAGSLERVAEVYAAVPSGRLVVLGKPGSGKTVFTTRFVLGVETGHIPVIFPLASWDPDVDLREWMAGRVEREHGPAARLLVEAGRVLPVLDGFDEIAPALRDQAIRRINASLGEGDPVVLTSRVAEYAAAADVVTGAAAVVLADLDASDVEKYLRLSTRGDKWGPVVDRLLPVLDTPLMLTLARTVYDTADPAELLAVPDPQEHLLSRYVPALYDEPDQRRFRFLARYLVDRDTHELAWWELQLGLLSYEHAYLMLVLLLLGGAALLSLQPVFSMFVALLVLAWADKRAGEPRPPQRILLRWSPVIVAAVVGFAIVGLVSGLVLFDDTDRVVPGVAAFALAGLSAVGFLEPNTAPVNDPASQLRTDRSAAVYMAITTLLVVLVMSLLFLDMTWWAAAGTAACLSVAAVLVFQAWGRFGLARAYLAVSGKLPWRLMAFLREAHRRGVLRQAGPVYQFRHARLRDQLAKEAD
ncbi:MAG: NACHT domain-containing protein [Umezawaea sp.]